MALPDLIARLEQEAHNRVEAVHRDADAEVRAIEEEAERAVADAMSLHLAHEHAARHAVRERELAGARRNARARELEAQHALLARVVARARSLLYEAAASSAYGAVLPRHLDEALSFLHGLHPRVRCQSAFAPVLAAAIARSEGAILDVDEAIGPGIIAEAGDGSVIVDNTLAARLTRVEPELAVELARRVCGTVTPAARTASQYASG
jgi:vacuolar-type H+-ATPase subunit E/Vma4